MLQNDIVSGLILLFIPFLERQFEWTRRLGEQERRMVGGSLLIPGLQAGTLGDSRERYVNRMRLVTKYWDTGGVFQRWVPRNLKTAEAKAVTE